MKAILRGQHLDLFNQWRGIREQQHFLIPLRRILRQSVQQRFLHDADEYAPIRKRVSIANIAFVWANGIRISVYYRIQTTRV